MRHTLPLTLALLAASGPPALAQQSANVIELASPTPQENGGFGASVAWVPDVDGDGVDDLAVGAPGEGRVHVFSGRSRQLIRSITSPEPIGGFGRGLLGLPDVDGDGAGDLAVVGVGRIYVIGGGSGRVLYTLSASGPLAALPGEHSALVVGVPDYSSGRPTYLSREGRVDGFDLASGAALTDALGFDWQGSLFSPERQGDGAFGYALAALDRSLLDDECPTGFLVGAPGEGEDPEVLYQRTGERIGTGRVHVFTYCDYWGGGSNPRWHVRTLAPAYDSWEWSSVEGFGSHLAVVPGRGIVLAGAEAQSHGGSESALLYWGRLGQLRSVEVQPFPREQYLSLLEEPRGARSIAALAGLHTATEGQAAWVHSGGGSVVHSGWELMRDRPETRTLSRPPGAASGFGGALAGLPDLTGDGNGELLVGDPGAPSGGRAYLYLRRPAPPPTAGDLAVSTRLGPRPLRIRPPTTDPAGWGLTLSLGSTPNARLSWGEYPGEVLYRPNAGFAGEDHFEYTVTDINGGTATARVTVTVLPPPPPGWAVYDAAALGLLSGDATAVLSVEETGRVWVGTTTGLAGAAHGVWTAYEQGPLARGVTALAFPSNEGVGHFSRTDVVAGTPDGVVILTGGSPYPHRYGVEAGLPDASVSALRAYRGGDARGVWVGTPRGLALLTLNAYSFPDGVETLTAGDVRAVEQSPGGDTLWVAVAPNGQGVEAGIHEFVRGGGGWVRRAFFARPNVGLCLENATALDFDGTYLRAPYVMYGSTPGGGTDACTPAEAGGARGLTSRPRPRMARYDGSTWISSGPVLAERGGTGASWREPSASGGFPEGLPTDVAYGLGVVWLGMTPLDGAGGGLAFAFPGEPERTGGWTVLRQGDPGVGLPSSAVRDIALDRTGLVWAATSEGVARYEVALSAPALLSPVEGAEGAPVTPLLRWEPAPRAVRYRIQIASSAAFSAPEREWTAPHPRLNVPSDGALDPGTTYYWRARSESETSASPWSPPATFRTGDAVLRVHEQPGPAEGVGVEGGGAVVWALGESRVYRYDGAAWALRADLLADHPTLRGGAPPAAPPRFEALSVAPTGGAWAAAGPGYFVVGPDQYLPIPGLVSRLAATPTYHTAEGYGGFTAVAAVDAETSWACRASYTDPPALSIEQAELVRWASGTTTPLGLPCDALAAAPDGSVWVAGGGSLRRVSTAGQALSAHPLPSGLRARTLALAPNGSVWVGTDAGGVAVLDGGTWRTFSASEHAALGTPVRGVAFQEGTAWVATGAGLLALAGDAWTAYTRAQGALPSDRVTDVAAGAGGAVWAATEGGLVELRARPGGVGAEGGSTPEAPTLAVYPTPLAGGGTVEVSGPSGGALRVDVFDVLGRRVRVLYEGDAPGMLALPLGAEGLAGGVYVVRAQGEGYTLTRRVVVAR